MPDSGELDFERAPVVETVLGVQFAAIPKLSNARLGQFWTSLGADWPEANDAPALIPVREQFGAARSWSAPQAPVPQITSDPSCRVQIRNKDRGRMIQVQNGRFHYNWLRKPGAEYPHFAPLLNEFQKELSRFVEFVAQPIRFEQWEVTYVNHFPRGTVWETTSDWADLFRGLNFPRIGGKFVKAEGLTVEATYEIPAERGRLHLRLDHGYVSDAPDPTKEILRMELTSRGPVTAEISIEKGLDLGRRAINSTFSQATSEKAQKYWGIRDGHTRK